MKKLYIAINLTESLSNVFESIRSADTVAQKMSPQKVIWGRAEKQCQYAKVGSAKLALKCQIVIYKKQNNGNQKKTVQNRQTNTTRIFSKVIFLFLIILLALIRAFWF